MSKTTGFISPEAPTQQGQINIKTENPTPEMEQPNDPNLIRNLKAQLEQLTKENKKLRQDMEEQTSDCKHLQLVAKKRFQLITEMRERDRSLRCPGCKWLFSATERIPRFLPDCGHTFCEVCLQKNKNAGHSVCKICGELIPEMDIKDLPKNLMGIRQNCM